MSKLKVGEIVLPVPATKEEEEYTEGWVGMIKEVYDRPDGSFYYLVHYDTNGGDPFMSTFEPGQVRVANAHDIP